MSTFRLAAAALSFLVLAGSARAQFEGNETCQTASPIAAGSHAGFLYDHYNPLHQVDETDFDFLQLVVEPGFLARITLRKTQQFGSPATMYATLQHVPCFGGQGIGGSSDGTTFTWVHANTTGAPMTLILGTWIFVDGWGEAFADYTLDIAFLPAGCPDAPDDALEPAGSATSRPIGFGTVTGLRASYVDDDVYTLQLPRGTTIAVTVDLQHALGDLDLSVYDDLGIVSSTSLTNQEQVLFTNATAVTPDSQVFVRVGPKPNGFGVCNTYSLTVDVVATALGTSYCPTNANGSGMEARIVPGGSSSVSANDLHFVGQLFPGVNPGILFAGTAQTQTPLGDGWLCTGGNVVRLRSTAAQNGTVSTQPNFTTPQGALITAGTTWNFQVFYRDLTLPGGAGFNLTNAVAIPMTP